MHVYKPSKTVDWPGVAVLLVVAVVGGALLGGVVGVANRWLLPVTVQYPNKLFIALALGIAIGAVFVAGLIMKAAVKLGKICFPAIGIVGGAVCTVTAISSAVLSFQAYGSTEPSGWLAVAAGVIFIGIGAMGTAYQAASAPFCEACVSWFGKERILEEYPYAVRPRLIALLQAADIARAEQLIVPERHDMRCAIELATSTCRCPKGNSMLLVKKVERELNPQRTKATRKILMVALSVTAEEEELVTAVSNPADSELGGHRGV